MSIINRPPGVFDMIFYLMISVLMIVLFSNVGQEFKLFMILTFMILAALAVWIVRLVTVLFFRFILKDGGVTTSRDLWHWMAFSGLILFFVFCGFCSNFLLQVRFSLSHNALDNYVNHIHDSGQLGMVGLFNVREIYFDEDYLFLKVSEGMFDEGVLIYCPNESDTISNDVLARQGGYANSKCSKLSKHWWAYDINFD